MNEEDIRFLDNQSTAVKEGDEISIILLSQADKTAKAFHDGSKEKSKERSPKKTVKKAVRRTSQVETSLPLVDVSGETHHSTSGLGIGQKYDVVTNVRQASVTVEIGIVCLELQGYAPEIKASIKWLERLGVSVEPVEINVIES